MNADTLADLEDERRYLLRSLRDLDAELAVGDVEPSDYATLRDGYTQRAATVLREIEAGQQAFRRRPPRRGGRSVLMLVVVVAIAIGLGWWVARSSGQRLAGQQISGLDPRDQTAAQLSEARSVLGTDQLRAIELYGEVLDVEPEHPEALTYSAWLAYLTSRQLDDEAARDAAVQEILPTLRRAIDNDATYPDPHCFLGIIGINEGREEAAARREIDECLALDPPAFTRRLVEQFVAGIDPPASTTPG